MALDIVSRLCSALDAERIDDCHWKSNPGLERSASGANDLDLLVSRRDSGRFAELLHRLGFKEALAPEHEQLPGVANYYGMDPDTGRLIHIHAHHQLILGSDLSKNYRLPVEKIYLSSSAPGGLFRVPAPEYELVMLVLRMTLKHSTWDSILMGHGRLAESERHELECLSAPEILARVDSALDALQIVDADLFALCLRALQSGCPVWLRIQAGERLQQSLNAYARLPRQFDAALKFWRRIAWPIQARLFHRDPRNQLVHGGFFIAVVGGDGAGKTTVLDDLTNWLSDIFEVDRLHMGKPRWSTLTICIRACLKIGTTLGLYPFEADVYEAEPARHGFPWFIRAACTARDRYLTYVRARRSSANGRLVLCDRLSLPGFLDMDGPQCMRALKSAGRADGLRSFLARIEDSYYRRIGLPDLLIVLRVDPDAAVQRKPDENPVSVRARSGEVWDKDWSAIPACLLDASLPREDVRRQIRALIWENI